MNDNLVVIVLALALSLDAFSVSISCGIKLNHVLIGRYLKISITFGLFQALMPLGGFLFGSLLSSYIQSYTNWISCAIFLALGLKTLYETKETSGTTHCQCQNNLCLASLGLATSIDALLAGVIIAFLDTPLLFSLSAIGVITFVMSFLGCTIGSKSNLFFKKKARLAAGLILLLLAVKSLM
ncbi:manganese efflux pump MntP family protein [Oligoflexia bacterium]|nr:manganese efflux pump MntP family protein [Oligoflexia bacterium]